MKDSANKTKARLRTCSSYSLVSIARQKNNKRESLFRTITQNDRSNTEREPKRADSRSSVVCVCSRDVKEREEATRDGWQKESESKLVNDRVR